MKLSELSTFVTEKRSLAEKENILTLHEFIRNYQLILPFESMEDFQCFEQQLLITDKTNLVSSDLVRI